MRNRGTPSRKAMPCLRIRERCPIHRRKVDGTGATVLTLSDSSGLSIYDKNGIDAEKLQWVMDLKKCPSRTDQEYAKKFGAEFHAGKRPWGVPCDVAFPSATQNEVSGEDAALLVKNGCRGWRGRKYAKFARSYRSVSQGENPLRSREGGKCRRSIGLRT